MTLAMVSGPARTTFLAPACVATTAWRKVMIFHGTHSPRRHKKKARPPAGRIHEKAILILETTPRVSTKSAFLGASMRTRSCYFSQNDPLAIKISLNVARRWFSPNAGSALMNASLGSPR